MNVIQQIPDWFNGSIGDEKETVSNPFTGESIELSPLEVAIYDLCMGANMVAERLDVKFQQTLKREDLNPKAVPFWETVRNCTSWFREHNAKAYMVLLD